MEGHRVQPVLLCGPLLTPRLLCLQTEIGVVTRRHGSCPHEPSPKKFRFPVREDTNRGLRVIIYLNAGVLNSLCGLVFFVSFYSLFHLKFQIYISAISILKVNTSQSG